MPGDADSGPGLLLVIALVGGQQPDYLLADRTWSFSSFSASSRPVPSARLRGTRDARPPAYGRIRVAEQGADIVAVAAWLGDTVETVHRTYAHLMPDADDRGRKAKDEFFKRVEHEGSALNVPSGDAV